MNKPKSLDIAIIRREKREAGLLVKRMNQRLRELEKQGLTNADAYRQVQTAYAKGATYLTLDTKGRVKFRTDIAEVYKEKKIFNKLIVQAKHFGELKSSQRYKIEAYHKKSYETAKKRLARKGIHISMNDYLDMWGSEIAKNAKDRYGSERVLKLMRRKPDDVSSEDYLKTMENIEADKLSEYALNKKLKELQEKGLVKQVRKSRKKK